MDMLALSDRLYEAALDEAAWDGAIQAYAEAFGGLGVAILRPGFASPVLSVSSALREGAEVYNQGWWREDIVLQTAQRLGLDQAGVTFADDFLSPETKARNAYFQDFLRAYGIGSVSTVVARPNDGDTIAINVQRRYGLAPPGAAERLRFVALSRSLTRALSIRLRLGHAEAARHTLVRSLADFDCAAAIADDQGRIVETNSAFQALAAQGLAVRRRRVQIATASAQLRFDALLQAVVTGAAGTVPDTLMLPRAAGGLPILARITPLAGPAAERLSATTLRHGALILMFDAAHAAYPDLQRILARFGLSPSQARVALLIGAGHTVRSAADVLAVGEETVRTHLKGAFARLGLSRQSDLVRLLARVAPFGR